MIIIILFNQETLTNVIFIDVLMQMGTWGMHIDTGTGNTREHMRMHDNGNTTGFGVQSAGKIKESTILGRIKRNNNLTPSPPPPKAMMKAHEDQNPPF